MASVLTWLSNEGRNGWDHPLSVPPNMSAESLNVMLRAGWIAAGRRPGSLAATIGSGAFALGLTNAFLYLPSFTGTPIVIAGDGGTNMYQVAVDGTGTLTIRALTISHGFVLNDAVQFNDKLFMAGDALTERTFALDASLWDGTKFTGIRYVGLAQPAAPTVANNGVGGYAAVPRWYQVQYRVKSGTTILRESELSTAVAFTPNGVSLSARVTKPAAIGEGETHWAVYGSAQSANGPFYQLAEIVVGTTTYDDTAAPSTYNGGTLAPVVGAYTAPPRARFVRTDGARMFWNAFATNGRYYFSPVSGSTNTGDDERVQLTATQQDFIDAFPGSGYRDTALAGPSNGTMYAFQSRGITALVPTGNATTPIRRIPITPFNGALNQATTLVAEDKGGQPAIYFLDPADGPRRITIGSSVEWLGRDVNDLWNTALANGTARQFAVFDQARKLVMFWLTHTTVPGNEIMLAYSIPLGRTVDAADVRYGWATWTGALAKAQVALPMPATSTVTDGRMAILVLLDAPAPGGTLVRLSDTAQDDAGTAFQGAITSKAWNTQTLAQKMRATDAYLAAKAQAGSSVQLTMVSDWGKSSRSQSVSLTPDSADGAATRLRRRLSIDVADAVVMQATIGDAAAVASTWQIDQWAMIEEAQNVR